MHKDNQIIKKLGGTTAVAAMLNKNRHPTDSEITPQRINHWRHNGIPKYFLLAYKNVFKAFPSK